MATAVERRLWHQHDSLALAEEATGELIGHLSYALEDLAVRGTDPDGQEGLTDDREVELAEQLDHVVRLASLLAELRGPDACVLRERK